DDEAASRNGKDRTLRPRRPAEAAPQVCWCAERTFSVGRPHQSVRGARFSSFMSEKRLPPTLTLCVKRVLARFGPWLLLRTRRTRAPSSARADLPAPVAAAG